MQSTAKVTEISPSQCHIHAGRRSTLCDRAPHTRVSPSGARGSVIQEPNLDPDVLMVMGSLMPVSLPHAARKKTRYVQQRPFAYSD